jgi:fused signal recognition particle receptor
MFWRRRRDDAPTVEGEALPEIDLDAPEPDPSEFELDALDAHEPAEAAGPAPGTLEADPLAAPPEVALNEGLARTRGSFVSRLRGFLGGEDGEGPSWDDVEETLIAGDVGATLAMDVVERARRRREPGGAEAAVRAELAALLVPREEAWEPRPSVSGGPAVVLIVGVNGTGKTTTIGKLATRYAGEGRKVLLAAADTFRAAAIDQLMIWAERADVPVVSHAPGADPGAVVYDALDAAVARGIDLVIADTAGRLHTKANLMEELSKSGCPGPSPRRSSSSTRRPARTASTRRRRSTMRSGSRGSSSRSSTRPRRAGSCLRSSTISVSRSGSSGWGRRRPTSCRSTPVRSSLRCSGRPLLRAAAR